MDNDIHEAIVYAPAKFFARNMYNLNVINKDSIDTISKLKHESKYELALIVSSILRVSILDDTKYKIFKEYLKESNHYTLYYKIDFVGLFESYIK